MPSLAIRSMFNRFADSAHQAVAVFADVGLADVIAENQQHVRLVGGSHSPRQTGR